MMNHRYSRRFALLFVSAVVARSRADDSTAINHGESLITWLRSKGGFLSDKLEIRTASDPNDVNVWNGVFATGDFKENELLISLPPNAVISSQTRPMEETPNKQSNKPFNVGDDVDGFYEADEQWYPGVLTAVHSDGTFDIEFTDGDKGTQFPAHFIRYRGYDDEYCVTARNLAREMKLGEKSEFSAYVLYLLDQKSGQLPSAWSDEGKELLLRILGQDEQMHTILPPDSPIHHLDDWRVACAGADDPLGEDAYMFLTQRGWDDLLLPVYDMMNHQNGKKLNTKTRNSVHKVHNGVNIEVLANRDIQAGEEICLSYYLCEDCGNRLHHYGTPEALRDYGFVEQFPQRWIFERRSFEVAFDLDLDQAGELAVSWMRGKPPQSGIDFLQDQLARLKSLDAAEFSAPENELEIIRIYYKSLMTAMELALIDLSGDVRGDQEL